MSSVFILFGIDPLPSGVESGSLVALVGTWWGTGLVAPLRSALAGFSVFVLLAILPIGWRPRVALALGSFAVLAGVLVGRLWAQASGISDDSRIAIDEVAGLLVALIPVLKQRWPVLALGTVLFGVVDNLKPWPVSTLESDLLPWSLGILLDDVAAGLVVAGLLAGSLALQRLHASRSAPSRPSVEGTPSAAGRLAAAPPSSTSSVRTEIG